MKDCRRKIINAIAFLLAGAVINIAVAWGLALDWIPRGWVMDLEPSPAEVTRVWRRYGDSELPPPPLAFTSFPLHPPAGARSGGPRQLLFQRAQVFSVILAEVQEGPGGAFLNHWIVMELQTGLPMLGLVGGSMYSRANGSHVARDGILVTVGMLKPGVPDRRLLPLRPIWPGFAINTLFYAGVLWMLFCGPFALRRIIRKRRGRCAQCAYPIGQSPVCTECGAAVTPKTINV